MFNKIIEATKQMQEKLTLKPTTAIILGTGLGSLIDEIENPTFLPYEEIKYMPTTTVKGHSGQFVAGNYKGQPVIMMDGRFHFYEGYSMKEVVFPIYVFKQLGVTKLIITNSCGAINTNFKPGDLVVINDFISLVSHNPLIGINDERLGPRFPDMSEPYNFKQIQQAKSIASTLDIHLQEGVYGFFSGPYYETRAEIKAFGQMGCDLIGMSTVPETIAANHCGLEVLAISNVTNMATGIQKKKHSHDEVVKAANKSAKNLQRLIGAIIENEN